jgi:uncharacterized protein (TIGR02646 family)
MIKLHKLPEPDLLKNNKAEWTTRCNDHINKGQPIPDSLKYKYRDPQIKQRILEEVHEKCAYCESKVTHVYPGDIEHIAPRSKKPELAFEWSNLTFSCSECNRKKSDYYDPGMPLINPYDDEPADHFFFAGPMIFHQLRSERGLLTRKLLELNRPALIERRAERLETIANLRDLWARYSDGPVKVVLLTELRNEAQEDREYSYMVYTFLRLNDVF